MEELVDRIVARVGVDRPVAESAIGIILDFLVQEGPADRVQTLIDRLPGADAAIEAARAEKGASGLGGMFRIGGIMGVGSRLMGVGLGMSEIQGVIHELIAFTREKAGDEAIAGIVDAIPGLRQFI